MAKTPGEKARRKRQKSRQRLRQSFNPKPTATTAKEEKEEQGKGTLHRPRKLRRRDSEDPILFGPPSSSSSSDSGYSDDDAGEAEAADVEALLAPYSKDQLVVFLCDAALADAALADRIRAAAEGDVSHRKVFVRGLPWDVTSEKLLAAFVPYGAVNQCHVVLDKATGRGKGYGFVLFGSRAGALAALREPQKQIGGRVAHCQLASLGSSASGAASGHHADTAGRKIYITNVHAETNPEKLRAFFAQFGEIETGPTGFDLPTGKSKGYAIFVYKTNEGARKALEEPYKLFEGNRLQCQWATEPAKVKELLPTAAAGLSTSSGVAGAAPQSVLAAVAAAQNFSLYSQNPAYAALWGQNPLLAAAAGINPAALAAPTLSASALSPAVDGGFAGYGGSSSLLGAYGTQGTAGLREMQYGQSSLGRLGSSYDGMSSYL
uniref:Heterogeneous nuclear ribonucleoprotein A/B n=1 Tax=Anthurium amnicola TaxID=1678845 RepID=A0A1D1YBN5_9ARAE